MFETFFAPENLVLIAGAIFTLAYLIIHQVAMRIILLFGSGFYIWYYAVIAQTPLWEAIYTSIVMILANVVGLVLLYARGSRYFLPKQHRDIYPLFDELQPGDFRQLLSLADRRVLQTSEVLTREGAPVERLFYVISGTMTIDKLNNQFRMPAEVFVGEVAYLTNRPATATTYLPEGAEVLEWDVQALRRKASRKPRFKMALEAMISQDLAQKVAVAVAPAIAEDLMAARPVRAKRAT
ncbi:cyclic nucleotide-binding domain-containing protein [Algirhabdus cladophorae]|uniref:cyclic nucleotide-binding domain-containing protein n=1 Tax=Algirhabdus cladophorae TaxID=3377108 RepID=UPI003B8463A8